MALPRRFNLGRPRDAPSSARPFPKTQKWVKLLTCPTCKLKGLQMFYAPHDPVYTTRCIKCSHPYRITPQGMSAGDVRAKLGGHHHNPLIREHETASGRRYVDATRLLEDRLDYHADPRAYYRRGAQPTLHLE